MHQGEVLQSHAGVVSSSNVSEESDKMDVSHMLGNSRVKNGPSSDSAMADSDTDDIETESNQIFQQMFSGQRSIDDMIQMLTYFKESSDKREQSIYECMIANVFEEFKFLTKYPDKQLRIAAILFGSLIKRQLVTHLTLGIALRAVLDSLRKPADSKMFSFGTEALEQFVDRLIEWPQYCNHILQISHLRATHSELVAFVERTIKVKRMLSIMSILIPSRANPIFFYECGDSWILVFSDWTGQHANGAASFLSDQPST